MIICDYIGPRAKKDVEPRVMVLLFKTSRITIMTDLGYFLDWAQKAKTSDSLITLKCTRKQFDRWYKEGEPLVYVEAKDIPAERKRAKAEDRFHRKCPLCKERQILSTYLSSDPKDHATYLLCKPCAERWFFKSKDLSVPQGAK